MGNVLRQLSFQSALLLLLRDIVDRDFKTQVLENDALHDEDAAILVDRVGHTSLLFDLRSPVRLIDEVIDGGKLFHAENLLGSF